MKEIASADTRGFLMLPQGPEQVGYYTNGTPGGGAARFAHPTLLSLICRVESFWQAEDGRKLGIGHISVAGGTKMKDHRSHQSGLDVDVRPLRQDGNNLRVTRFDKLYDHDATAKLVGLFLDSGEVDVGYFNHLRIRGVKFLVGHDDHLQSLSCRYRKGAGHACDFGLDLTTGKTVPGSTC